MAKLPAEWQPYVDGLEQRIKGLEAALNGIVDSEYCVDGYRNVSVSEEAMDKAKALLKGDSDG